MPQRVLQRTWAAFHRLRVTISCSQLRVTISCSRCTQSRKSVEGTLEPLPSLFSTRSDKDGGRQGAITPSSAHSSSLGISALPRVVIAPNCVQACAVLEMFPTYSNSEIGRCDRGWVGPGAESQADSAVEPVLYRAAPKRGYRDNMSYLLVSRCPPVQLNTARSWQREGSQAAKACIACGRAAAKAYNTETVQQWRVGTVYSARQRMPN
jgi:hypothetical protein